MALAYGGGALLNRLLEHQDISHVTIFTRNIKKIDKTNICDNSPISFTDKYDDILQDKSIEAVFCSLPASCHYEYTKKALMQAKHAFVEKPLSLNHGQATELNLLAESFGLTLAVDHTFLYTPQIQKIKEIIKNGDVGKLKYYHSTRVALGNICKDANVTYDLAVHDIAILLYLFEEMPISVSAIGNNFIDNNIFSGANINLFYKNGFYANIKVDWNFPFKVRDIFIGGSDKYIKYSDNLPYDDRLIMYNSNYYFNKCGDIEYNRGHEEKILVSNKDAIDEAIKDFIFCCKNRHQPVSTGILACNAIYILEKINDSIAKNGQEILI